MTMLVILWLFFFGGFSNEPRPVPWPPTGNEGNPPPAISELERYVPQDKGEYVSNYTPELVTGKR